MNNKNQEQSSGDDSQNLQAGRDIIIQGLTYSETKDLVITVAQEVFRNNSIKLANEAYELVQERSEEILENFLKKLEAKNPQAIETMRDPGMQFSLFNAQKEYARTGDKGLADLLEDILVDRAQNPNRDLMQIVLDECISVAPKLTPDQFDALSLIFILRYTINNNVTSINALLSFIFTYLIPFVEGIREEDSRYQHLEFTGCGTLGLSDFSIQNILRQLYMIAFSKGFPIDEYDNKVGTDPKFKQFITPCFHDSSKFQISLINKGKVEEVGKANGLTDEEIKNINNIFESSLMGENEVRDYLISLNPSMNDFINKWDKSDVRRMTLTSVGIAIGHANISRKTHITFDLKNWIK